MNLSRLTYGQKNQLMKIVEIDGGTGARENIESHGLKVGDEILFKSRENGRGKIIVEYNNKEIKLGHELASKIIIESPNNTTTLNHIKVGDIVEVTKMEAKDEVRFRLLDMGLVKGVQVKIIRVAPLGDPIEILINGFNLSLRVEESKDIEVKIIEIVKNHKNGKKRWGVF